jgi:allantoin racemase
MRNLLVINPNTSQSVTALLQHHVQAAAGLHVRVRSITARFGAPYIADEASYAIAGHATLDAWAAALSLPNPHPILC